MNLPISANPPNRTVTAVSDSASEFRNAGQQQPPGYIYRGELLESLSDRSYRPQYNLQISPENRRAIASYQRVFNEEPVVGRILDGFI